MPFKKGHKKIAGKQKGTQNKLTVEQKERIEYVLSLLDDCIEMDIMALKEVERVKLWADLQEYIRPKLARTEHLGKDGENLFDYSQYTFEQLYMLKYGKKPD